MIGRSTFSSALVQLALAALGLGFTGPSGSLTVADRRQGVDHLERSRATVVGAVGRLSQEQWNFREAPGRWSVGEVVEHLALSEEVLFENVQQVMKAPAGQPGRDYKAIDRMVLTVIPDRSNRASAAPPTVPTGRWKPGVALAQFRKQRDRTIGFLRRTPDLREHVTDSPLGQPMDAYQWLLFISAHTERHLLQIREVMAHPRFPK